MPIPTRHRFIVALLATCLCINQFSVVLSQELRPFESETSSPSHPTRTSNNNEESENLVITSPGELTSDESKQNESEAQQNDGGEGGSEEYSENDEDSDNEYEGDGEGSEDSEDDEEDEEQESESGSGGGEEEAQATGISPQYALPEGLNVSSSVYPDTNVSASSIIYRTTDLETAATG